MTKLSEFISTERERFEGDDNNRFAFGFAQISRYQLFLSIIVERYEEVKLKFLENHRATQALFRPGTHPMTAEHVALHEAGIRLTTTLHLEMESFYLFAKIYLDKISRALEFYFGQGRGNSLNSHHKLVKHILGFAAEKGLTLPMDFVSIATKLQSDISEYRDKQIAHEQNPRRTNATMFDDEGNVWMATTSLYPTARDQQVESEVLQDLMQDLDKYDVLVVELLTLNREKTRLKTERAATA